MSDKRTVTVMEPISRPLPEYGPVEYTYEDLREMFDDKTLVWALLDRIEELETDAINNEGTAVALREGYLEAIKHIEELEKELAASDSRNPT